MDPPPSYTSDNKATELSAVSSNQGFPPPNQDTNHAPVFTVPQQYPNYPLQPQYPNQQLYQPQQYPPPQPQPFYPPQQQQQQQQSSVVVMNAGQSQLVGTTHSRPYQSFCGHIVLACCVTWCCNFILGVIAFILAMIASDRGGVGRANEARQLGRASIGVSIAGIIVTVVIVSIVLGVCLGSTACTGGYSYSSSSRSSISPCYCKASFYGSYAYRSCSSCYSNYYSNY